MPRKKHLKILEVKNLPNVFEHDEGINRGWHHEFFVLKQPVVLELGCGSGAFSLELAKRNRAYNCIGVDIKGARIWQGANIAHAAGLQNVAFLRAPVESISDYFYRGDVAEIWITFPDPYAKKYNSNKRLTSVSLLAIYREVLMPNGLIHMKTDNTRLFDFTLRSIAMAGCELIKRVDDLYANGFSGHPARIPTAYEQRYLEQGKKIRYLCFRAGS